jgi:Zn-dependent protease with chaperone function
MTRRYALQHQEVFMFCTCFSSPSKTLGPHGGRRLFTHALLAAGVGAAVPAAAQNSSGSPPSECRRSRATRFVSADQIEQGAAQQYAQMMQKAQSERALAPAEHPQLQRLRYIENRIRPHTFTCNERARQWQWEVNLIGSRQVNAFCMPGGKIAFYFGILSELQLDDDEVAMIMGHEAAHALLEHAREQIAKTTFASGALRIGAALLGLGQLGDIGAQLGAQLLQLQFSRTDESQADMLGLLMAARAGYDPRKGVSLWQKMSGGGGGSPPEFLSTHPSSEHRIKDIQGKLAQVQPVFQRAAKPERNFGPPARLPPAQPRQTEDSVQR